MACRILGHMNDRVVNLWLIPVTGTFFSYELQYTCIIESLVPWIAQNTSWVWNLKFSLSTTGWVRSGTVCHLPVCSPVCPHANMIASYQNLISPSIAVIMNNNPSLACFLLLWLSPIIFYKSQYLQSCYSNNRMSGAQRGGVLQLQVTLLRILLSCIEIINPQHVAPIWSNEEVALWVNSHQVHQV